MGSRFVENQCLEPSKLAALIPQKFVRSYISRYDKFMHDAQNTQNVTQPIFGLNGAVLNAETMTAEMRGEYKAAERQSPFRIVFYMLVVMFGLSGATALSLLAPAYISIPAILLAWALGMRIFGKLRPWKIALWTVPAMIYLSGTIVAMGDGRGKIYYAVLLSSFLIAQLIESLIQRFARKP